MPYEDDIEDSRYELLQKEIAVRKAKEQAEEKNVLAALQSGIDYNHELVGGLTSEYSQIDYPGDE